MRLRLLTEAGYDHGKSVIPVPYMGFEFRRGRSGFNQWHVISDRNKVDTQLVPILFRLWDAGFMTEGSCRGSSSAKGSCGYINFIAKPVPAELMPQLGRPQKTFEEIKQFCRRAVAESDCLSYEVGQHTVFLLWSWENFDCALAAIEGAIR